MGARTASQATGPQRQVPQPQLGEHSRHRATAKQMMTKQTNPEVGRGAGWAGHKHPLHHNRAQSSMAIRWPTATFKVQLDPGIGENQQGSNAHNATAKQALFGIHSSMCIPQHNLGCKVKT